MFTDICFYVKGNAIEVNGQDFLLGRISCACLNITPAQFDELYEKSQSVSEILNQNTSFPDRTQWNELNRRICVLSSALKQYPLFNLLADESMIQYFEQFVSTEDMLNPESWELYYHLASSFIIAVEDIFSFNKTIYNFIELFLSRLKKLDTENYAAAYYDFLNSPQAYKLIANPFEDGLMTYTSTDFLEMNLIPMEYPANSGQYLIAEYYHTESLQSLLKTDFLKGLMVGHHIRRCEHCKRFFLLTKGYKTKYCDNPAPENPKYTCNQMAYRTVRCKEENPDNPKYQSYRRCVNRIMRNSQQGCISQEQKDLLLRKAGDLYHIAVTSPEYTNEEFEQALQTKNLYTLCKITPPKKGRPKHSYDE